MLPPMTSNLPRGFGSQRRNEVSESNSNPNEGLGRGEIASLVMFGASAVCAGVAGLSFYATYETKGYATPLIFALLSINFAVRQVLYK
jgi:hypothetical protein